MKAYIYPYLFLFLCGRADRRRGAAAEGFLVLSFRAGGSLEGPVTPVDPPGGACGTSIIVLKK